jgi:hypothetical protein
MAEVSGRSSAESNASTDREGKQKSAKTYSPGRGISFAIGESGGIVRGPSEESGGFSSLIDWIYGNATIFEPWIE